MVVRTSRRERRASNRAQIPGPCGSADAQKIRFSVTRFLFSFYCSKKPNTFFFVFVTVFAIRYIRNIKHISKASAFLSLASNS